MKAFRINGTEIIASKTIGAALLGYEKETGELEYVEDVKEIVDFELDEIIYQQGDDGVLSHGRTIRAMLEDLNESPCFDYEYLAGEE